LLIAKVSLILSIHRPFNLFNRIPIIPDHMYPINKVNPIPVCISDHIFPWIQWIQFRYTSRIILFVPRIQVIGIDIPDHNINNEMIIVVLNALDCSTYSANYSDLW
jgi:hypothetical protein